MCTVTVIPMPDGGVRLASSRDEQRSRPMAVPPALRVLRGGLAAAWPTDPAGGGTWVAASSRGLCVSLLNVNEPGRVELPTGRGRPGVGVGGGVGGLVGVAGALSRGLLIPSLIDSVSPGVLLERLARSELHRFMPFRIVAADASEVAEFRWDGRVSSSESWELSARCFVSSGLGDERAAPRLGLWQEWLCEHGPTPEAQDAFHAHQWPDRPEISVRMDRADARTVSVSVAHSSGDGGVTLRHIDDAGTHELVVASVVVTRPATFVSRRAGDSA